jgi:hypothetical protein
MIHLAFIKCESKTFQVLIELGNAYKILVERPGKNTSFGVDRRMMLK